MSQFDSRVDAYIAKSQEFARPILEYIREVVHEACPDVEETIKWGFPHFEYKGLLCSMASFKKHCAFGFWKGAVMNDPKQILSTVGKTSMGNFEKLTAVNDLPGKKILISYVRHAMELNEDEKPVPLKRAPKTKSKVVPAYLRAHLNKNTKALATFESLSTSHRNDYVDWIVEAKTEATRKRRITQAMTMLAEGKSRNWKYERK